MRLKRYKKKGIGSYLGREIIILLLGFFSSLLVINSFYDRYNDVIMPIAEAETRKYMSILINDSTRGVKFDGHLFNIERSVDNEIKMITYDSYEATKLINEITNNIQDKLDSFSNSNYVITEIPLGLIFKNGLLRNFGPKVSVKLDIIGDVISELETEVKPYGINNALVEVRVKIDANAMVVLPLVSKEVDITNIIPISINIVNGSIPEAYISTYK